MLVALPNHIHTGSYLFLGDFAGGTDIDKDAKKFKTNSTMRTVGEEK